jgi:hypothetical protein
MSLEDLREATFQTSNVGALIAKAIDPMLVDLKRLESPLRQAFPRKTWPTNTYLSASLR